MYRDWKLMPSVILNHSALYLEAGSLSEPRAYQLVQDELTSFPALPPRTTRIPCLCLPGAGIVCGHHAFQTWVQGSDLQSPQACKSNTLFPEPSRQHLASCGTVTRDSEQGCDPANGPSQVALRF